MHHRLISAEDTTAAAKNTTANEVATSLDDDDIEIIHDTVTPDISTDTRYFYHQQLPLFEISHCEGRFTYHQQNV